MLVTPAGQAAGGSQDAAAEAGGPPPGAAGSGEQQPGRVGPGVLLGPGPDDAGGDLLGERVTQRGAGGVDGLAALAALGCPVDQPAGDLDDLAVHADDAAGWVDLDGGQGSGDHLEDAEAFLTVRTAGSLAELSRGQHAKPTAIGIGHDHPADLVLADADTSRPEGDQTVDFFLLVAVGGWSEVEM